MSEEPIIALQDLHRSFTVRQKIGRVRRQTRVVHAVDGITRSITGRGGGRLHRGERRRQVHHHQDAHRHPGPDQRARCVPAATTRCRSDACSRVRSGWSSASAASCGGTCRCATRSAFWRRSIACRHVDAATRIEELVERLGLGHLLDAPVRQLSLGQRMRGEVAAALLHRPRLLVLDEPTIGLDMISKERLRHFLLAERAEFGTTLLLTTHDMGDIERLCERVLVVDHGHLVFDGTLSSLAARVALQRVLVVDLPEPGPDIYVATATHIGSELDGQRQRLAFSPQQTTAARVLAEVSAVAEVIDLTLEEPAIEDIVRTLYGVP